MDAERITRKQIARIWATARSMGIDRDLLYTLVPGGSISHLTKAQAARFIEALDHLEAARYAGAAKAPPPPSGQATESQKAFIRSLFRRLGWHDDERRERGFLRKYAHVESIDDISDRRRAIAVIEALKAILARRERGEQTAEREGRLFSLDKKGKGE